jgi:hypothetical protein
MTLRFASRNTIPNYKHDTAVCFTSHITIPNVQANELTAATTYLRQILDEKTDTASDQFESAVCRTYNRNMGPIITRMKKLTAFSALWRCRFTSNTLFGFGCKGTVMVLL